MLRAHPLYPPPIRLRLLGGGNFPKSKGWGGQSPPQPLLFGITSLPIFWGAGVGELY